MAQITKKISFQIYVFLILENKGISKNIEMSALKNIEPNNVELFKQIHESIKNTNENLIVIQKRQAENNSIAKAITFLIFIIIIIYLIF